MSSTLRRRVVVTGLVQGVFYRDSCRTEAIRRGVAGWVRNREDGAVEAVFEGPSDAVVAMVAWCRTGPPQARVSEVQFMDEVLQGERGFAVTH